MALQTDDLVVFCLKLRHQQRSLAVLVDHVAQKVLRPFDDSTNTLCLEVKATADIFHETQIHFRRYREKTKDFAQTTLYDIRNQGGFVDFAEQTSRARELQEHFENVLESLNKVLDTLTDVKARAAHGKKDMMVSAWCNAGQILGPTSMLGSGAILTYGGPVIAGIATGYHVADRLPLDNTMLRIFTGMIAGAAATYLYLQFPGLGLTLRILSGVVSFSASALSLKWRSEFEEIIRQITKVQLQLIEQKETLRNVCQLTGNAARKLERVREPKHNTRRRLESIERAMESLLYNTVNLPSYTLFYKNQ